MYNYGWSSLFYGRNQHKIVIQFKNRETQVFQYHEYFNKLYKTVSRKKNPLVAVIRNFLKKKIKELEEGIYGG